ncbi:MAG: FAD-dependent oxidoreductase [Bacteroidales bacterium]|nr:FAD-dependent oxidoreductase [Bacteroidales bacterium]MBN2820184.1 FAD-dependent oxidoreductase [Bacteroidales bacterium]
MREISSKEFEKEVLQGGKVVLDFYSTECPPCEALAPKFESVAELFTDDAKFFKIFRQENRDLSEKLSVKGSPTVLFYEDGKEVGVRLSGGIRRHDLFEGMKALVGKERVKEVRDKIKPIVSEYDVAILGGGPGGLTAGLYLCQAKINTALIDIGLPGGNVATTHMVSNYPGFIDPQPGYMLSHYMSEQTKQCGTTYKVAVDVTHVDLEKKEIVIDEFETIKAKKIIIATGTSPNYLGVPGEKELKGNGISYCATCDAKYFVDKEVIVVGGGNSAIEEADFITKFASKVTIVHQFDKLQANKTAQEKAFNNPKISFMLEHEPRGFQKSKKGVKVEVEDLKTKERKEIDTDGAFIFVGLKPNLDLFNNKLELDDWGYIKTNEDKETSIKGVYAVGDVASKKYRQITTAIADGTIAAISITRELDK